MKKIESIPFNIWDDFWDDGYAPEGEIQETHGYIEEYDRLTDEQKEEIVCVIFKFLQTLDFTGVELELQGEHINFKHLTHKRLDRLMEELEASQLRYTGNGMNLPIYFYSES